MFLGYDSAVTEEPMTISFKAYRVEKGDEGVSRSIKEMPLTSLPEHDVTVRVALFISKL